MSIDSSQSESRNPGLHGRAVRVISQVVEQGRSLNQCLPPLLSDLSPSERGRLQDWCFGTCRWWFRLNHELDSRLTRPLRRADQAVRYLMLIGLYQLRYSKTPPHAVLNESVGACRALGHSPLTGLVNGVLRKAQREGEPATSDPAVTHSHPQWIVGKLQGNWPEQAEAILAANNQHPPFTLRVNQRQGDRDLYLSRLAEHGIDADPCDYAPSGLRLRKPVPVDQLPGFAEGDVSVQDEAAQLCVGLLELAPGHRVLDACAAPGGKTAAIAEAEPDLELLTAVDADQERLERVRDNLERLGLDADVICGDAAVPQDWAPAEGYDRILLDAPCSATGVIRRHPDIKLLRRETDIAPLADIQLGLMKALWPLLKPGGRLVYATCSVFSQENSRIVSRFLNATPDAQLVPLAVDWGHDTGYGRQLLPQAEGADGFFYACLNKAPGRTVAA